MILKRKIHIQRFMCRHQCKASVQNIHKIIQGVITLHGQVQGMHRDIERIFI